ncbi:MAG: HD domain-containing protein [Desulfatiglandales bacterium]
MRCPGQDTRYWKDRDIFEAPCPHCGNTIEFFKDDTMRPCKVCGNKVPNPKLDFGCALHCKFAEQCLGSLPKEILQKKGELLKDRVAIEVKRYFKKDFKEIAHAAKVARYAERIAKKEGGDLAIVLCASYLHDLGAPETGHLSGEERYLSQEKIGAMRAEEILRGLGAPESLITPILEHIAHHHHPKGDETEEFKALYDADQIADYEEECLSKAHGEIDPGEVKSRLFTEEGKRILEEVLQRSKKGGV